MSDAPSPQSSLEGLHSLDQALTLTPSGDDLIAVLHEDFSNARVSAPPTEGFPFGGLMAALAAQSMREGTKVEAPLRTLAVQFMAAAGYGSPLTLSPRVLRGGRTVAFTAVDAVQNGRAILHASATWGTAQAGPRRDEIVAPPPPIASLDPSRTLGGPLAPRFARYVDYIFEDGPNILGGNENRPAVERLWMRIKGGAPITEAGLCYLLDALYPPAWTVSRRPPAMTSIDLRYDFIEPITPETAPDLAPDGWLFFAYAMKSLADGWSVDDCTVWAHDGRPVAVARQLRKVLAPRRPQ